MPLRATDQEEALGMDIVQHGEQAYMDGEGAILVTAETGAEEGVELPGALAEEPALTS